MCGQPCTVTDASYTQVTCLTPALATPTSLQALNNAAPTLLNGTSIGVGGGNYKLAYDGNIQTTFNGCNSWQCCGVGIDLGASTLAAVTEIQYYPNFQRAFSMAGGIFQGSVNGSTWVTLGSVDSNLQEAWSTITVNATTPFRYLRYKGPGTYSCEVSTTPHHTAPFVFVFPLTL